MNIFKRSLHAGAFALAVFAVSTCGISACAATPSTQETKMSNPTNYKPPITGTALDKYTAHPKRHLVIETKQGKIVCQLFEKVAPNHVAQFIMLAKDHFYDGTYFHRTISGFMIQGGDPNTKDGDFKNDGMGGYSKNINQEFNEIHHARGILSTARAQDPNSASSQFFVMHGDAGFLDRQYTVWGQVIEGIDIVDKIIALPDATTRSKGEIDQGGVNPRQEATIIKMYVEGE
jgi:peptidyl-prolyl cis-trans isomerase B (cyclophilin B)